MLKKLRKESISNVNKFPDEVKDGFVRDRKYRIQTH